MGQDQERMGPSKERSAGQRTFLSLTLIGDVLFGVQFENNCDGCCECASRGLSLFSFASR